MLRKINVFGVHALTKHCCISLRHKQKANGHAENYIVFPSMGCSPNNTIFSEHIEVISSWWLHIASCSMVFCISRAGLTHRNQPRNPKTWIWNIMYYLSGYKTTYRRVYSSVSGESVKNWWETTVWICGAKNAQNQFGESHVRNTIITLFYFSCIYCILIINILITVYSCKPAGYLPQRMGTGTAENTTGTHDIH